MTEIDKILSAAVGEDRKTLSEYESTRLLANYDIPVAKATLVQNIEEARKAAGEIGYPVVLKVCSPGVSHKTEMGLVAVDLRTEADLELAFKRISQSSSIKDGGFLVQEMIKGDGADTRSSIRSLCHVWLGRDIYRGPRRCLFSTGASQ